MRVNDATNQTRCGENYSSNDREVEFKLSPSEPNPDLVQGRKEVRGTGQEGEGMGGCLGREGDGWMAEQGGKGGSC